MKLAVATPSQEPAAVATATAIWTVAASDGDTLNVAQLAYGAQYQAQDLCSENRQVFVDAAAQKHAE